MPIGNINISAMDIHILKTCDKESLKQINCLLRLLSPDSPEVGESRLSLLVGDAAFTLFIARDDMNQIAGMLTLTGCPTLSCTKYWIEDVVVDSGLRGKGIGRALVRAAVRFVNERNDGSVIYLTSNPSRTAARNLYRSEGFEEYETGVFRIK